MEKINLDKAIEMLLRKEFEKQPHSPKKIFSFDIWLKENNLIEEWDLK